MATFLETWHDRPPFSTKPVVSFSFFEENVGNARPEWESNGRGAAWRRGASFRNDNEPSAISPRFLSARAVPKLKKDKTWKRGQDNDFPRTRWRIDRIELICVSRSLDVETGLDRDAEIDVRVYWKIHFRTLFISLKNVHLHL